MERMERERRAIRTAQHMRHNRLMAVYERDCGMIAIVRMFNDKEPIWHDIKTDGTLSPGTTIHTDKRMHLSMGQVRKLADTYNVFTKRVDRHTCKMSLYGLNESVPRFGDGWNTTYGKRRLNFVANDVC